MVFILFSTVALLCKILSAGRSGFHANAWRHRHGGHRASASRSVVFWRRKSKDFGWLHGLDWLIALSPEFEEEEYRAPGVATLLQSLLNIGTIYKQGFDDPVDTLISRVIKQNSDAKVQPINSFQWAVMLQTLFKNDDTVTLDDAMQRYNMHPEVQGQGGKMTATW